MIKERANVMSSELRKKGEVSEYSNGVIPTTEKIKYSMGQSQNILSLNDVFLL